MFGAVVGAISGAIFLWSLLRGNLKQSSNAFAEHQSTLVMLTTEKTNNAALQTTIQAQTTQLLEYKQNLEQAQKDIIDLNARCAVAENQNDAETKLVVL